MHSFMHQHPLPPPSPAPYSVVPYNGVHHNQHPLSQSTHVHTHSLSLQSYTSPPTLQQLTQAQASARQGQSSPVPSGSNVNGTIAPNAHWQQQLLKAELCRTASPAHHRARQSALATRNSAKSAIPITNPNQTPTKPAASKENGHGREQSISSLLTDGSVPPDPSASEHEHPSATSAPAPAPRPTAARKVVDGSWTTLDMGGMQLKNLAKGLFNFTFLTTLYLNHNHLSCLPAEISRLRNLIHLDLSGNQLTTLTPSLGMLTSLRELLLFDNRLTTLPPELGNLHQLQLLGIEGNPLDSKMRSITQKDGTVALIAYLRDSFPPPQNPETRQWQPIISEGERRIQLSEPNASRFNVLCYNILCEKYATSTMYGYTPTWALDWSYRKEKILGCIVELECDIVCLEEVSQIQYEEFFSPSLHEHGWDSYWAPKGRAKTMPENKKRETDGCATFYKIDKYLLIENQVVEFRAIAIQRKDFDKSDDMFNRVFQRDDIAVVTLLEERATGARLIVANLHIYWDPDFRDVKLVQVGILMEELQRIADQFARLPPRKAADGTKLVAYSEGTKIPLIICGDFNSVPDSGVYQYMNEGFVPPDHPDFMGKNYGEFTSRGMGHKFNLKSAYASIGELPLTNYTPSFQGALDYIWYSTNNATVTDVLGEVDEEYISRVVGFPNAHFPSDHIHLCAEFIVKTPKEANHKQPAAGPPGLRHPGLS